MRLRLPRIERRDGGARRYAPRPETLDGMTIGFLDGWGDGEGGMYPAMAELERALHERYGVTSTVWVKKPSISHAVPAAQLDDFARRVDLVINGEGL
jgi:hypothetical protein